MSEKRDSYSLVSAPLGVKNYGDPTVAVGSKDNISSEAGGSPPDDTVHQPTASRLNLYICVVIAGAYIILLLNALQMTVVSSLAPYVTSDFNSHSLLPITSIASSLVTGILQLPLSRIIDYYGRPQGLIAMIALDVLGLIVMATCTNVKAYAAAQVLYIVGADGVIYIIRVFAMDKASIESRPMVYGLSLYTYFITPFAGPALAQSYYKAGIWRWAFGSLALIIPGVSGTLVALFMWYESRHQRGSIQQDPPQEKKEHSTVWSIIWFHILQLDVLGVLLACFGFALLLLPLSLTTSGMHGWASGTTISMLVIGVVCLVVLAVYEARFAPQTFIDFSLLRDRTAWGACICIGAQTISLYIWWSYYTSFLQVVHFQSIRTAGYILNVRQLSSAVFSVLAGLALKYTHRFKALNCLGLALTTLGTGLMIHLSHADSPFGGVITAHVLISMASGVLAASEIAAVLNDTDDSTFSMRVAMLFLFSWIGSAIGSTIATPLWRSRFPHLLETYLPSELRSETQSIFGSLAVQLSYEPGTPGRNAIIRAMTESWRSMTIVSTAMLALGWAGVLMLKEGKKRGGKISEVVESA